jgi:alcohol dehydrogenase (cytochrome c)
MCLLDALDAATGEYLFSIDAETQDVITAIDPKTGAKTIDRSKWPDPNRPCDVCPNPAGARSWPPTAYSPQTNHVYVPIMEWCMRLGDKGMSLLSSGVKMETIPHPDGDDGMLARLQAMDLDKQELAWAHNQVEPMSTSVLATAGDVLFVGDMEPSLKAFDAKTGEELWQGKLDALPSSSVITYAIGDQQYVAVVVGFETIYIRTLLEARHGFLDDEYKEPTGGNSVWVFAVPHE